MQTAGTKAKTGGKNKKFGRNSRAPSNQNQQYRSAKNKRVRIEREARRTKKVLKKSHGTARAARRFGMGRKAG